MIELLGNITMGMLIIGGFCMFIIANVQDEPKE